MNEKTKQNRKDENGDRPTLRRDADGRRSRGLAFSRFSPEPFRPLSRSPAFSCSGEVFTDDLRFSGNSVADSFWMQLGINNSLLQFATCLDVSVSCPRAGSGAPWLALLPCFPSFNAIGCPLWPVFWPPPSTLALTLARRVRGVSTGEWGATCLPTPQVLCWVSPTPLPPDSRHTPWRIPPPKGVSRKKKQQEKADRNEIHIQNASHLFPLTIQVQYKN